MKISLERINSEVEKRAEQWDSASDLYMERVKERMLLGEQCKHPPLFSRGDPKPRFRVVA